MVAGGDVVAPKSVRDLVRPQLGLEEDPWELALVQRDLVWKQDRMVGLLDSLLAGYPIGSLLLCRVRRETDARQLGSSQGQERRVAAGTPQLVDSKQRSLRSCPFSLTRGTAPSTSASPRIGIVRPTTSMAPARCRHGRCRRRTCWRRRGRSQRLHRPFQMGRARRRHLRHTLGGDSR